MKRLLLFLLAVLACASDLGAVTYHYVVAETSQSQLEVSSSDCDNLVCTASSVPWCIQSGALYHCNVSGGNYDAVATVAGVSADIHLNLEGSSGDSYLVFDSASRQVRVYINGASHARVTQTGLGPGECPSELATMEAGTECFEPVSGKLIFRDADGVWQR